MEIGLIVDDEGKVVGFFDVLVIFVGVELEILYVLLCKGKVG